MANRNIDKCEDRQTKRLTDRKAGRIVNIEIDIQTKRQTDRQES
jgi:hypothetical protein